MEQNRAHTNFYKILKCYYIHITSTKIGVLECKLYINSDNNIINMYKKRYKQILSTSKKKLISP